MKADLTYYKLARTQKRYFIKPSTVTKRTEEAKLLEFIKTIFLSQFCVVTFSGNASSSSKK